MSARMDFYSELAAREQGCDIVGYHSIYRFVVWRVDPITPAEGLDSRLWGFRVRQKVLHKPVNDQQYFCRSKQDKHDLNDRAKIIYPMKQTAYA